MRVTKQGDVYVASYITGPTHNLLRLKLKSGAAADSFAVNVLPPNGECRHGEALTGEEMIPSIRAGVERANADLGARFAVELAEIVANDSRQPPIMSCWPAESWRQRLPSSQRSGTAAPPLFFFFFFFFFFPGEGRDPVTSRPQLDPGLRRERAGNLRVSAPPREPFLSSDWAGVPQQNAA